jgi:metallo-beta-lactamase family protein
MKEVKIWGGGSGKVTGMSIELTANSGRKILIDRGKFQGPGSEEDNQKLKDFNSEGILACFSTHPHNDHIGGLPATIDTFPIYSHRVGTAIAAHILRDSDHLSNGLYPEGNVDAVLSRFKNAEYDVPIPIDGLKVTFRDAKHVPGSASLEIEEANGQRLIVSGDIGNPDSRLFDPAKPLKPADIVIIESTYGDRLHPKDDPIKMLEDDVKWIKKYNATLLCPTFALHRTQDLLHVLKGFSERKLLKGVHVFMDGKMASAITKIFNENLILLKEEFREQPNPFSFQELTLINGKNRNLIYETNEPKIIIAGPGMVTGGLSYEYALDTMSNKKNLIDFSGYCVEESLGRAILDTRENKDKKVQVGSKMLEVEATVHRLPMSAHADQQGIVEWVKPINKDQEGIREVIIIHGPDDARNALASRLHEELGIKNISLPKNGETINLFESHPYIPNS